MLIRCINFPRQLLMGFFLLFLEKWYEIMWKKTNRGKIPQNIFHKACVGVENDSMSLRQSARIYGIDKMVLLRYINKKKQAPYVKVGYFRHPSFTHLTDILQIYQHAPEQYQLAPQWGKLIHFTFVQKTFFHSFCMYFLNISFTIY